MRVGFRQKVRMAFNVKAKVAETRAAGPAPEVAEDVPSPFDLLPGSLLAVILGMAGLWKGEGVSRLAAAILLALFLEFWMSCLTIFISIYQ